MSSSSLIRIQGRAEPKPLLPGAGHGERWALVFGSLGVLGFSLTFPAIRMAVPTLGGTVVGLGRALVAAVLAAVLLSARRERLPARRHLRGLVTVAAGVVVGFPLCSSLALKSLPSAHGAVVVGLLPAATAIVAVLLAKERPSLGFWLACGCGVVGVLLFAWVSGDGRPRSGDLLLLVAVGLGGLGYAEGGRLAQELGGWRVICWALVIAAPFVAAPVAIAVFRGDLSPTPRAWLGFGYVSVFSMFFAFFAWYRALAEGGIARISQLQLAQPILTLGWSAWLLGEKISLPMLLTAVAVIASVAMSRRMKVVRRLPPSAGEAELAAVAAAPAG